MISTENAEERTLAAGASRSDGANVGLVLDSDVLMRQQYRFESCQDACKMEAARARTHTHTRAYFPPMPPFPPTPPVVSVRSKLNSLQPKYLGTDDAPMLGADRSSAPTRREKA